MNFEFDSLGNGGWYVVACDAEVGADVYPRDPRNCQVVAIYRWDLAAVVSDELIVLSFPHDFGRWRASGFTGQVHGAGLLN